MHGTTHSLQNPKNEFLEDTSSNGGNKDTSTPEPPRVASKVFLCRATTMAKQNETDPGAVSLYQEKLQWVAGSDFTTRR